MLTKVDRQKQDAPSVASKQVDQEILTHTYSGTHRVRGLEVAAVIEVSPEEDSIGQRAWPWLYSQCEESYSSLSDERRDKEKERERE